MARSEMFAIAILMLVEALTLLYAYFTGFWVDWTIAHIVGLGATWLVMEAEYRGNRSV